MEGLQFKIASMICARSTMPSGQAVVIAADILAIPEIAEALAFTGKFKESGYNVSVEHEGAWTRHAEPGSW